MKQPFLRDEKLLEDIKLTQEDSDALHIWWLGQSGFLIQWQGRHILIDPYLSDSLTEKYKDTDKPHVRMVERVIDPSHLDFIDVVTSTHNHTDHLDAETLNPLRAVNPNLHILVPEANREFAAERLQCAPEELIGMNDGDAFRVTEFIFYAIPAAHEKLEQDEDGNYKHLGYGIQCGPICIYHSGDTVRYKGMDERLIPFNIDIALLPINGRNPERRVPGNLTGPEAVQLAHDIGARVVIPCHFDMFEFNSVTPDEFSQEAKRLHQGYCIMRNGERFTYKKQ